MSVRDATVMLLCCYLVLPFGSTNHGTVTARTAPHM